MTKTENIGSFFHRFLRGKQLGFALTGTNPLIGRLLCKKMSKEDYLDFRAKGLAEMGLKKNNRILDVGCGNGILLHRLRAAGFKRLLGVDAYIFNDITSDGIRIIKGEIADIIGKYDLIMFQQSFEHITCQLTALQHAYKLLEDHGFCLLNMPVVSSYAWETYHENWFQLDAPRHLCLHSLRSIEMLALKAKFKIEKIVFNSNGKSLWASEQYRDNISPPNKTVLSPEYLTKCDLEAQKLNTLKQGDNALFYLRKAD